MSDMKADLDLTPEQFAKIVQKQALNPRLIVKNASGVNQILTVGADGISQDTHLQKSIIKSTMLVNG